MCGPSSGMFELRLISNQKWANTWLVLRYIGLGQFIIILPWTYFGKTSSILQSSRLRHLNIYLERKQLWQKRPKMLCYNLHRRWNLSINVRDRDLLLVSSLYLRFQFFSYLHFFTFCYLSWPRATLCDVASSDHYESNLFNFMSVLAHQKFPQKNQHSFWHNDVGK